MAATCCMPECFICHKEGGSKVCSNRQCQSVMHADCLRDYRHEMHKIGRGAVCACTESLDWQALWWPNIIAQVVLQLTRLFFLCLVFEWVVWRSPSTGEVFFKTMCVVDVFLSRFEKLYRVFLLRQTASNSDAAGFVIGGIVIVGMNFHMMWMLFLSGFLWPDCLFSALMALLYSSQFYYEIVFDIIPAIDKLADNALAVTNGNPPTL